MTQELLCKQCGHPLEYHEPYCEKLVRDYGVTTKCNCSQRVLRQEAC